MYLDDVIIRGKTFEEHLVNVQTVFERLRQTGLKLQPRKCAFLQREVRYFGHIVSDEGVAADPAKVDKVACWPEPATTKEVKQFLGFAGYYRRFIRDFAQISRPLHCLTEKKKRFLSGRRNATTRLKNCATV